MAEGSTGEPVAETQMSLDAIMTELKMGFHTIDARFDTITSRLDQMSERLNKPDAAMGEAEGRISTLEDYICHRSEAAGAAGD